MPRLAAALALVAAVALAPFAGLKAADGQYTVRLEAVAHEGGPPVADRMVVKIWARNGSRTGGKIAELAELPAKVALTPGEYRVLAIHDHVRRVQDIEVGLNGRATLNLAAGDVELGLRDGVGGDAVSGPVVWSVHRYKRGQGVGAHIVDVTGAPARVRLTAGYYDVVAAHGGDRVNHVIEVIAGQVTDYTLVKR
jgi:hypothetical protein